MFPNLRKIVGMDGDLPTGSKEMLAWKSREFAPPAIHVIDRSIGTG